MSTGRHPFGDLSVTPRQRLLLMASAVVLSLAIFALSSTNDRLGDAPLFLFAITLTLGALAYGLRGGVALGVLTSALASVWWLDNGQIGGTAWIVSRTLTSIVIGGLLGWFVDTRERLVRELENHSELSLDLVATASFDGYFTRVNPAFTRTLGYTAEELRAQPFIELVHPDDRAATLQAVVDQTDAGLEIFNFQNRYRAKDGSYRWLEWTSRPDARAGALIAIARDVTDRKRLEALERRHTEVLEAAVRERTAELDDARREILRRLALAAEYRDQDTHHHVDRVGRGAGLVASKLGLPEAVVELIRDAAPLHDLGKLGVSDAVLLKPGRLNAQEFESMKRHTELGSAMLSGSSSDVLRMAEEIALNHHEWWDGSGYPAGLSGEAIPMTARIVAVVDVFDALTHDRPYKPAWTVEDAVAEMHLLRGRHFDPAVVDAFDRLDPYELADLRPGGDTQVGTRAVA